MRILFTLFCFILLLALPAKAAQSPWSSADQLRGKLLSATNSTEGLAHFDAALQMQLGEGWHTYWRVPGDAGLPPRFDWSASQNVKRVDVGWPAPVRKDENGFTSFAYLGEVVFPLHVHLENPGEAAHLSLKLVVMICKNICIPQNLLIHLEVPALGEARSPDAGLIDHAKRKIPAKENTKNLKIDTIVAGAEALVISVESARGFKALDVFASAGGYGFTASFELRINKKDKHKALIKIPKPTDIENLKGFLEGKRLEITVVRGNEAAERVIEF